jgi:hypothetical protein
VQIGSVENSSEGGGLVTIEVLIQRIAAAKSQKKNRVRVIDEYEGGEMKERAGMRFDIITSCEKQPAGVTQES